MKNLALLDHLVSIDSIFIVYPCFNDSLLFSEPIQQLSNKSLSKENNVKNNIKLFPNPANSQINIQTNNGQLIEKIIISDIRGMVIKTIEIKDKLSLYHLNTEKINAGNYFIQVITNQLVYNQAIIIAR